MGVTGLIVQKESPCTPEPGLPSGSNSGQHERPVHQDMGHRPEKEWRGGSHGLFFQQHRYAPLFGSEIRWSDASTAGLLGNASNRGLEAQLKFTF